MPIKSTCPGCDTTFTFADAAAGKKVRCKSCQRQFVVRSNETPSSARKLQQGITKPPATADSRPKPNAVSRQALGRDQSSLRKRTREDDEGRRRRGSRGDAVSRRRRDDDDKDRHGPGGNLALVLGLSIGGAVLLGGGIVVFLLMGQAPATQPEPVAKKPHLENKIPSDEIKVADLPKAKKPVVLKKPELASDNLGKIEGTAWKSLSLEIKGQEFRTGHFTFEFAKDGSLTIRDGAETFNGKYSLGPKDKVTFHIDHKELGQLDRHHRLTRNEDRLTVVDPDGTTYELVRHVPDGYPELAEDDPYYIHYRKLALDPERFDAEIKNASEWLLKHFKADHPWRGKIAAALEGPIEHVNLRVLDVCWESFTTWAVPKQVERLKHHLTRAAKSEQRSMVLHALAGFETRQSLEVVASQLDSPQEQELVQALLAGVLNRALAAQVIEPYVYHFDVQARLIACSLCEIYGADVGAVPRLPVLKDNGFSYEQVPAALKSAAALAARARDIQVLSLRKDWAGPERLRHLAVVGWLQRQNLSAKHVPDVARALDPLLLSHDDFLRSETLRALKAWGCNDNVPTLIRLMAESEFKDERGPAVDVLQRLARDNPSAFDAKLCRAFDDGDRAQRLEAVKVMELAGGRDCVDTLTKALADFQGDAELATAITKAIERTKNRKR
jgi:hypothetical protein